ncbi:magnesium-translocating P-type ATPase [Pseudonocardia acaciae]|uniref:magnesium-translocating P-type ATPase n=1 Tax=Pseudonocardia acaciae TaxID=551276 RepID=UPI00055ABE77|nr:magnesium-translocating P-type ATPase [Pseudonocardia acaciae]
MTVEATPAWSSPPGVPIRRAAAQSVEHALAELDTTPSGLTTAQVAARRETVGPNAVRSHRARPLAVLVRQLRSALLVLLLVTAVVSYFLGEHTDAVIITVILVASVGLGFVNEYRAERAAEALHTRVRHTTPVLRDGAFVEVEVTELVPGDVVRLRMGAVVPADVRLLEATGLECDESVLTGETSAAVKGANPVAERAELAELSCCALMGTVVRAGGGLGVVAATGARTEFGRIALELGQRQPETEFQAGLRRFSELLLQVAVVLTSFVFMINLLLSRPLLDSLLFALAIAVGITPQLLPAVVATSLATGSRRLARRRVLVKRLVCIEDLGDLDVLVTDKTGTLTEGRIDFTAALSPDGTPSDEVFRLGLLATETDGVAGANPIDAALWRATDRRPDPHRRRLMVVPFDHERRMTSALTVGADAGPLLVVKGAPESVLARCPSVPDGTAATLHARFAAGDRVIAVATRPASGLRTVTTADERDLDLAGFLVFSDRPKADAADALRTLARLGVTVKIATGDNPLVAERVCAELGLASGGTLTGAQIETMDDEHLAVEAASATIFARVSPEQKARLVRLLRTHGRDVGFLGDGVNDALALHAADVGLSVDTATDVAKDAADVVLLEKDLGVLAGGIAEGRRIFANTIKYVLMGTSSNFGNMFSAAAASAVLPFLPMLPSQILLNNLLYDTSQLAIPTDRADPEQLRAPSHWDLRMIRRFMLFFGPISSLFDFVTFGVMLGIFHAGPELFRSGWFIESLATQTLVIFAIRTRRVPFVHSRPSIALAAATASVVLIGILLPLSPVSGALGFVTPPVVFFLALGALVVVYLLLVELAKRHFFTETPAARPTTRRRDQSHRQHRRASRFTHAGRLAPP